MRSNVRIMYLRPGNLFKDFVVEDNKQSVTKTGRVVSNHEGNGANILKGCLADANEETRSAHSTPEHTVTHTIVQSGPAKAKRGDKLIHGERVFYIVDIDDTGALGLSTLYYAEERKDV